MYKFLLHIVIAVVYSYRYYISVERKHREVNKMTNVYYVSDNLKQQLSNTVKEVVANVGIVNAILQLDEEVGNYYRGVYRLIHCLSSKLVENWDEAVKLHETEKKSLISQISDQDVVKELLNFTQALFNVSEDFNKVRTLHDLVLMIAKDEEFIYTEKQVADYIFQVNSLLVDEIIEETHKLSVEIISATGKGQALAGKINSALMLVLFAGQLKHMSDGDKEALNVDQRVYSLGIQDLRSYQIEGNIKIAYDMLSQLRSINEVKLDPVSLVLLRVVSNLSWEGMQTYQDIHTMLTNSTHGYGLLGDFR